MSKAALDHIIADSTIRAGLSEQVAASLNWKWFSTLSLDLGDSEAATRNEVLPPVPGILEAEAVDADPHDLNTSGPLTGLGFREAKGYHGRTSDSGLGFSITDSMFSSEREGADIAMLDHLTAGTDLEIEIDQLDDCDTVIEPESFTAMFERWFCDPYTEDPWGGFREYPNWAAHRFVRRWRIEALIEETSELLATPTTGPYPSGHVTELSFQLSTLFSVPAQGTKLSSQASHGGFLAGMFVGNKVELPSPGIRARKEPPRATEKAPLNAHLHSMRHFTSDEVRRDARKVTWSFVGIDPSRCSDELRHKQHCCPKVQHIGIYFIGIRIERIMLSYNESVALMVLHHFTISFSALWSYVAHSFL